MLRLYGFRLTPDQPAAYSRNRAALGTFSILFGVSFCFGGGLQKIARNGMSLSLVVWLSAQSIGEYLITPFHTPMAVGAAAAIRLKCPASLGCRFSETKIRRLYGGGT